MLETPNTSTRIREIAEQLFMQYGLRSVSMDDIAAQCGMSKKTIYQYYSDKEQLVGEVVGNIIGNNQQNCNCNRSGSENAVHEIFLAIEMIQKMFSSMMHSIVYDMQKYHPATFQKFLQYKNDFLFGMVHENICRGIREDLYRPDLNTEVLARYRVEGMMIAFNPDFQSKVTSNLAGIQRELSIHFLFGLVNQKGYKLILKYLEKSTENI